MSLAEPAGFVHDVRAVAGRALRQIPREPASVIPAVFVPAFFYAVNLGALEKLAGTALDYKAFLLPMAIAFAVTGMSRAPALVTDIQGGYFDRLCMTPIKRSALLLGLMVADVAVIAALCLPVIVLEPSSVCALPLDCPDFWRSSASLPSGAWHSPASLTLSRAEDRQPRRGQCVLRRLLSPVLPYRCRRTEAAAHGMVLHDRHLQPRDVFARSTSLSHHLRVGSPASVGGIGRGRRPHAGRHVALAGRASGQNPNGGLRVPAADTVIVVLPDGRELAWLELGDPKGSPLSVTV